MKLTVKEKGSVIAELTLEKLWRNEWEISYAKVSPGHRGKKLASQLLAKACDWAKREGKILVGFVEPDGTGLTAGQIRDWLKRHGFKPEWYDYSRSKNAWYACRKRCWIYAHPL